MNTLVNSYNQEIWEKLTLLKNSIDKRRKAALKKRIAREPHISDLEYLLGAFLEMYEPHLIQIVHKLSDKGYAIETSSGFAGKYCEYQTINGYFSIDYVTKNKLEKIGVKFREYNGSKALIFWPEKADLAHIQKRWLQIIDLLPDKGILAVPYENAETIGFRRKYIPKDPIFQRQRLFERLMYSVKKKKDHEVKERKTKNPKPDKLETKLGIFVEQLEPQVRQAVLELNKKGYSTDISGFMNNAVGQMIEGDFMLDEKTIKKLVTIGVTVETSSSSYTRIQFSPKMADIQKIKKEWNKIVSLIPAKNQNASASMTRKAREFRIKFQ